MARGFKIADAYVEITADKDMLRQSVRGLPNAVGGDADAAGRQIGERVTRGLEQKVEQLGQRLTKTRTAAAKAADAVKLAEARLNEVRDKGNAKASQILAAEQKLAQARRQLTAANQEATTVALKHADAQRRLGTAIADSARKAGPQAEAAGRDVGGKLAMGMRMALIRKSPLIAAAIAAALAAGAPVALAAAGTLFAGVGAVAAAQSQEVRAAWLNAWAQIKKGAVEDAAVLVPTYVGMADKIAAGFEKLRPSLREAFSESVPLVERLTDGVLEFATNAMPGMVRAVREGEPVFDGLRRFLADTGTGLSDFFNILADHAPAAGEAFAALGQVMAELLPLLGQILGQGAELARIVLPPLAAAIGAVADAADRLGPLLPMLATGFIGLKVAKGVAGQIGGLATSLGTYAARGGAAAGVAGKLSGGLGRIAGAAGPASLGIGLFTTGIVAWMEAGRRAEDLANSLGAALEVGGSRAAAAREAIAGFHRDTGGLFAAMPDWIKNTGLFGTTIGDLIPTVEGAQQSYDDWYYSLDLTSRAAEDVRIAQQRLSDAIAEHGPNSREAAEAGKALAEAQREAARTAEDEERAIRGVTEAMLEQTDAVFAKANADLALRDAMADQREGFRELNEAINEHGWTSAQANEAGREWEGTLLRQVEAARRLAEDSLPAAMDANQRKAASDLATLDALRELEAQYGDRLPASIRNMIGELEAATAGYDRNAIEAEQARAEAEKLTASMKTLGSTDATPKVELDDAGFSDTINSVFDRVRELAGQTPTPTADMDDGPFTGKFGSVMNRVGEVARQRPTPTTTMDDAPFSVVYARVMARVATAASQRPTPKAMMNDSSFSAVYARIMSRVRTVAAQRPTPRATLLDRASGTAIRIARLIAAIPSHKTSTITTYHRTVHQAGGGAPRSLVPPGRRDGGPIKAAGGMEVRGPGGPRDDLVPALGPGGTDYFLSDGEWIVNARAVDELERRFGTTVMPLINQGRLPVPAPPPPSPATVTTSRAPATTGAAAADREDRATVRVGELHAHFHGGGFDPSDRRGLRRAAVALREELIKLERERR